MQLAEPEAFKQSEEAVSGAGDQTAELPFVNIQAHLAKAEVSVPNLFYYDQPAGCSMTKTSETRPSRKPVPMPSHQDSSKLVIHKTIDVLVRMQSKATSPADPQLRGVSIRSFDVPLLMWEFDHFLDSQALWRGKENQMDQ